MEAFQIVFFLQFIRRHRKGKKSQRYVEASVVMLKPSPSLHNIIGGGLVDWLVGWLVGKLKVEVMVGARLGSLLFLF